MLSKFFSEAGEGDIRIRRFAGARDVSHLGALPYGTKIDIELTVSRRTGASGAVLRLCRDGEGDQEYPLEFCRTDHREDVYSLALDTAALCGEAGYGLFYYEIALLCGAKTLYTDTYNNFDFNLAEKPASRFRLLVYEADFKTPATFGRGVMYQIFPDRFFKGAGPVGEMTALHEDSVIESDWEHGIPQYAEYPGAPLKNNLFFGGNLWGIAEKLDHLKSLGVTYLYLCPIFKAYSNHRYDTADYAHVDPLLGGDEAFEGLIAKAREKGIGIILDGVFNHTGDDSIYFDRYGKYDGSGACQTVDSPYRNWYFFRSYPTEYECWWGIDIMPKLNHTNESCRRYFTGKDGIIQKYIDKGIAGWRLDVADELCNGFLDELRASAKRASEGEAIIIGEVWENAADKIAYGQRRRYFAGRQLDSVMNYPLKNAILSFCLWGDGDTLYNTLTEIYSSYPEMVSHKLMNLLGTHDTERILTVLGREEGEEELTNKEKSTARLTAAQREQGFELLKIAAAIQFTAYGIPSVYYGDEIGLEGYGDPFCRMPYPWHETEDAFRARVLDYYRTLGRIRNEEKAFDGGDFYVVSHTDHSLIFVREKEDSLILTAVNRGPMETLDIPEGQIYCDLLDGREYEGSLLLQPDTAMILKAIDKQL